MLRTRSRTSRAGDNLRIISSTAAVVKQWTASHLKPIINIVIYLVKFWHRNMENKVVWGRRLHLTARMINEQNQMRPTGTESRNHLKNHEAGLKRLLSSIVEQGLKTPWRGTLSIRRDHNAKTCETNGRPASNKKSKQDLLPLKSATNALV